MLSVVSLCDDASRQCQLSVLCSGNDPKGFGNDSDSDTGDASLLSNGLKASLSEAGALSDRTTPEDVGFGGPALACCAFRAWISRTKSSICSLEDSVYPVPSWNVACTISTECLRRQQQQQCSGTRCLPETKALRSSGNFVRLWR